MNRQIGKTEFNEYLLTSLINFRDQFISSNLISLVVIDNRKLEEIETLVRKFFVYLPIRRFVTKESEIVLPFTKL